MAAKETETERFWMRIPVKLARQIERRAKAEGLSKTDWVRNAINEALEPSSEIDFAIMDSLRDLRARLDKIEARSFHENSALIHLGLIALREITHSHTAAVMAAALTGKTDAAAIHEIVDRQAGIDFEKLREEALGDLSELRNEARIKAGKQADSDGVFT